MTRVRELFPFNPNPSKKLPILLLNFAVACHRHEGNIDPKLTILNWALNTKIGIVFFFLSFFFSVHFFKFFWLLFDDITYFYAFFMNLMSYRQHLNNLQMHKRTPRNRPESSYTSTCFYWNVSSSGKIDNFIAYEINYSLSSLTVSQFSRVWAPGAFAYTK